MENEKLKRKAIKLHFSLTRKLAEYSKKENKIGERLGVYGPTSSERELIEPNIYLKENRWLRKPKPVVIVSSPYGSKNVQILDPKYAEVGEMITMYLAELENKKDE